MKRIKLGQVIKDIIFNETIGILPHKSMNKITDEIKKLIANNYRRRIKKSIKGGK